MAKEFIDGSPWDAAPGLFAVSQGDVEALASELAGRAGDAYEAASLIDRLLDAPVAGSGDYAESLRRREALAVLATHVAIASVDEDWEDLIGAFRRLACQVSYRVSELAVEFVSRIASRFFKESRSFWLDCLLEEDSAIAAATIRGLSVSDAPVFDVLDLLNNVIADIRKDVRQNLGPRAIPALGRRDPQTVYLKLSEWTGSQREIPRWNVARALGTPLGAAYPDTALEILETLAADERPSVHRAAADALVILAQRRPALVLPVLGRWRNDPARGGTANLALTALARR